MDFREELRPEEVAVLQRYGRTVSSGPGENVSFDPRRDVLFIIAGALHAKAVDAWGKTVTRKYASGDILNEVSILTAHISLLSVTASVASTSLLVSQDNLDVLVKENPKVAAKLFRHFAKLVIYRTVPVHANSPSYAADHHRPDSLSEAC